MLGYSLQLREKWPESATKCHFNHTDIKERKPVIHHLNEFTFE
jgi:hypothetical protein